MSLYEQSAAIAQMNQWGKAAKPFLFLVDYRGMQTLLLPLDEIDPDHLLYDFSGVTNAAGRPPEPLPLPLQWSVVPPTPEAYAAAFHTVVHHLKRGDSFLTNLTCRLPLTTNLSLRQMFHHASARYRLWWDDCLVCFSPEIFVQISEGKIHSFPMKGTLDAHLPNARALLLDNPKEAAEHATIVDLIRNDLSTIVTEVHVVRYRYVDTIATHSGALLQTSSEVVGTLPEDYPARLGTLLFRLLPAGSITGAPKPKTMDIIAAAETYERGHFRRPKCRQRRHDTLCRPAARRHAGFQGRGRHHLPKRPCERICRSVPEGCAAAGQKLPSQPEKLPQVGRKL